VWSRLQQKNNPIRHMRFPAMAARLRIGQSSAGSSGLPQRRDRVEPLTARQLLHILHLNGSLRR
jgi:hypothetical protein